MTQGVKRVVEQRATFRTVPSAGARHPFDTYIAINHVEGLKSGLYRYLALSHELILIEENQNFGASLAEASLNQSMVKDAAVTFIWVADTYRMTYRYGTRGYRYIFLDAGHVCQNLYLIAEQLGLGTCAIAAFDDDMTNDLMKLDGHDHFVVYMAPFGKIK
jgi:SagB-type dehydrogenase family enzyme